MIEIDGSEGEGGGQMLRSALALSMATGQAFRIVNIRANRPRPGLMRQHLTAVLAAGEVCGAQVAGAEPGAQALTFRPGEIAAGDYRFAIGTAGGTGLVFQTVFPALLMAGAPSRLRFEGGTHNPHSPPFEFLRDSFVGALAGAGIRADLTLERPGYYPAGGGAFTATVEPSELRTPLDLVERGAVLSVSGEARVSNLPGGIAEREARVFCEALGLPADTVAVRMPEAEGPGNVLLATVRFESHAEVYAGFGEHGVPAERVADRVVKAVRRHLRSKATVGHYLADQLLLPMAIGAGGRFTMMRPSRHFVTNAALIQRFLDVRIAWEEAEAGLWLVEVG